MTDFPDFFMWFPENAVSPKGGPKNSGQGRAPLAKADRVKGETTDAWFAEKNAFEILTFGFKMAQSDFKVAPGTATAGEGGKAKFQAFTVTKPVDKASIFLYRCCSQGTELGTAMLALRKAGGHHLLYIQYMFRKVSITGIDWKGSGGDVRAEETVTFEFEAMGLQYATQKADGSVGKAYRWDWNTQTNQPSLDFGEQDQISPAPNFEPVSQA